MSNELTFYINHLRYRAPQVVPLEDGRVAVLMPGLRGRDEPWICSTMEELHGALLNYIQWNVSEPVVTKARRAVAKASAGAQISDLINLINGSQK